MESWMSFTVVLTLVLVCVWTNPCGCYHTADNTPYDCWHLNASKFDNTPINCGGLGMEWVIEPPDEIEVGETCNISYSATTTSDFFTGHMAFPGMNASQLEHFCNHQTCPDTINKLNASNCCVWHANIHTCHPSVTTLCDSVCGPWVGNDGLLSTHTLSLYGTIGQVFQAEVQINYPGVNVMIAHLKVGNMQIAIGKEIRVVPPRVCGDDICSVESGENCDTCVTDCCPFSFPPGATAGIVIFCVLVPLIVVVLVAAWYYYQRRKLFFDESWIINYEDLQRDPDYRGFMGSMVSMKNIQFLNPERESRGGAEASLNTMKKRQMFTQTGIYERRTVAIKKVPKHDFVLNNTIRREVMQIRTMDHPNLCKFIGATVKDPTNLTIVSEYCPKGSLNDVLQNDDIPLNWGFRFSFATDIAGGMAYLHSKRVYHGRLTSSNCVIDDRWAVKITDYGLPSFRVQNQNRLSECYSDSRARSAMLKIYMPSEVRGMSNHSPAPTTDVYSYAIILLEIATRMDPYSEGLFLDTNWKPKVNLSDLSENDCPCPHEYLDMIHRCWSYLPSSRPTFDQLKKILCRINPYRESPVDMMMIMMEKYSKHLEVLVAERTQELIAEQQKTATLLYSMLPKTVADDLKQGKPAPATSFHSATVFFSDIVGFTILASTSTPMQVVQLLNELYSIYDDILDQFDVYKVETIGDAYMVVSGIPKENGDRHAGEIASMALQLVSACERFKIPHRPSTKMEIRAGIHSGPVCAGVVGLKMPRYCLFGDTVNTASRMETTCEAMKIQCSDATYTLLKKLGRFRLECRGNISVKGKGSMLTWWLLGEDDAKDCLSHTKCRDQRLIVKGSPNKQSLSEIVKDSQGRTAGGMNSKKLSREPSMNGSLMGQNVMLPGCVVIEELN